MRFFGFVLFCFVCNSGIYLTPELISIAPTSVCIPELIFTPPSVLLEVSALRQCSHYEIQK